MPLERVSDGPRAIKKGDVVFDSPACDIGHTPMGGLVFIELTDVIPTILIRFTPEEAREVAKALWSCADIAEGKPTTSAV